MSAVAQVPAATPAPITDTGMRGFLKWFKQNQPVIYANVAPKLAAAVPAAFSQYHAGGWKIAGLSTIDARKKLNALYRGRYASRQSMGALGYTNYATTGSPDLLGIPSIAPGSIAAQIANVPSPFSSYSNYASTPSYTSSPPSSGVSAFAPPVDVATAANSGPTSSSIASTVGSLINTASSAFLTVNAAQAQSNLVNTNLQRAQAGLPPLTTAISSLGVPIITGTSFFGGSSGMLLLLLGVGAVVLISSSKKRE